MDKLISKSALLKKINYLTADIFDAIEAVKNAPVIEDVALVVHAKVIGDGIDLHRCSRCGHLLPYDVNENTVDYWKCNYCPNCGAKMDGGTT